MVPIISLNPLSWREWIEQECSLEQLPEIYTFLSAIKGKYGTRLLNESFTNEMTAIFIVFTAELCNAIKKRGYSTETISIVLNGSIVFHIPQSSKKQEKSDLDIYVAMQKSHALANYDIARWSSLIQEARSVLSSRIGEENVPSIQVERTFIQDSVEV